MEMHTDPSGYTKAQTHTSTSPPSAEKRKKKKKVCGGGGKFERYT